MPLDVYSIFALMNAYSPATPASGPLYATGAKLSVPSSSYTSTEPLSDALFDVTSGLPAAGVPSLSPRALHI